MIQSLKLNNVNVKYLPTSQVDFNSNLASSKTHCSVLVSHHRFRSLSAHASGQSTSQLKLILPVGISIGEGLA